MKLLITLNEDHAVNPVTHLAVSTEVPFLDMSRIYEAQKATFKELMKSPHFTDMEKEAFALGFLKLSASHFEMQMG